MAKRGAKDKEPPFVMVPWQILNSKAYKDLNHSAGKILPYFIGKVKVQRGDPERYRMEFEFSYKEAERYGFAKGTFHRCLTDLVATGFIDPVDKGGLRGVGGGYSYFSLSLRWQEYGKPGFVTESWKCFEPRYLKRKQNSTAKMEIHNGKFGNRNGVYDSCISEIDPVEHIPP